MAELAIEPSAVVHKASNRRLGYGEIAGFAKVPEKLPELKAADLKPVASFRLIGKDVPRIDVAAKSTGARTVCDRRAGAGHGLRDARPRTGGGSGPTSFNEDELKKMPGIVAALSLEMASASPARPWRP